MKVHTAWVNETDLYTRNTEDGISVLFDYYVMAETIGGVTMAHGKRFSQRADAEKLVQRVSDAGAINPALWTQVRERESLESRLGEFGTEWQIEQDERRNGI